MKIKISKSQWELMGKKAGWANDSDMPSLGESKGMESESKDTVAYTRYLDEESESAKKKDIDLTLAQMSKNIPINEIDTEFAKFIEKNMDSFKYPNEKLNLMSFNDFRRNLDDGGYDDVRY